MRLDLDCVDSVLRQQALDYFEAGDISAVLCCMSNESCLEFVFDNWPVLKSRGLLEKAVFEAWIGIRTNYARWDKAAIRALFMQCNLNKLKSLGDPLPTTPVNVYRGVCGSGRERRVRGFSWTDSLDCAAWFALRFHRVEFEDPAIYRATVHPESIYFVTNDRQEREYVAEVSRCRRVKLSLEQLREMHSRVTAQNQELTKALLQEHQQPE